LDGLKISREIIEVMIKLSLLEREVGGFIALGRLYIVKNASSQLFYPDLKELARFTMEEGKIEAFFHTHKSGCHPSSLDMEMMIAWRIPWIISCGGRDIKAWIYSEGTPSPLSLISI
jgi:proteasome lid subunit RPN8/RPN11